MYLLITTLFIFLCNADTEHTHGYWAGVFSRSELTETTNFHNEFQIRKNTETGVTAQSLFRAGPLWKYSDSTEFGALYAFVRTGALTEHRLTQQMIYKFSDSFSVRGRLEQRTIEKLDGVAWRLRLQPRYQLHLNEKHSFVLWNEYFYQANHTSWINDSDFDRNRLFVGFRSNWNKLKFEYGYLNQFVNRSGRDLSEHLFLVYLIL